MSLLLLETNRRRRAPFSPANVAGLVAWYHPDQEAYADGAAVPTVTDRSGNTNNATQATGANQPTFQTNELNGRSVYRFDGANDWLQTAAITYNQPLTAFVVFKHTDLAAAQDIIDGRTALTMMLQGENATAWVIYSGASLSSGVTSDTTARIVCITLNGATSKIRVSGGAGGSGNAGAGNPAGITLGARGGGIGSIPFKGDMGQSLFYSGLLSLTNINAIGNYLAAYYALTWTTAT